MERRITEQMQEEYQRFLTEEEKSSATVEKYTRDLKKLVRFADGKEITKSLMISFKEKLKEDGYKISSINSYLIVANRFLEYRGWQDARVKTYRMQKEAFCPENKHLSKMEYERLVKAAKTAGKERLELILQTICATGMRISELPFVTVENVKKGMVEIHCKGKIREILIPSGLQKKLFKYIGKKHMKQGTVFQTSGGKPVDRSNLWKEMKKLCEAAKVTEEKVFPHNLRHLFAQRFYQMKKDIVKLADILGHSSIETTRIYTKTTGREHRKLLEKMDLVLNI